MTTADTDTDALLSPAEIAKSDNEFDAKLETPGEEFPTDPAPVAEHAPNPFIPPEVPQDPYPMYKSERKGNFYINMEALARDARDDIDAVRVINVPAPVKRHHIGKHQYEAPTLSEVGGGAKNNFCQVIADKDGRPVNVNEVNFINTDPSRANINHGTASISTGTYFAIGWEMKADRVILLYEVIGISEYNPTPGESNKSKKQIAKLTCALSGYSILDWKHDQIDIPPHLTALYQATISRMRNDTDYPFYMDIFRMIKTVGDLNYVADNALESFRNVSGQSEHRFMVQVMSEILDIRQCQYNALPVNSEEKRRVDMLRLIETLTLDPNGLFIDITITPYREDFTPSTFHLRLTPSNFADETGRTLLERGLTLGQTTFDKLKIDLEGRTKKPCVVHLSSLR